MAFQAPSTGRRIFNPILLLVIIAAVLLGGCEPGPAQTSQPPDQPQAPYSPYWDTPFSAPQYLIHATGHGTMDGPRDDDWWFLYGAAPSADGKLELPDGSGGTYGYATNYQSGPYQTPREVCSAAGGQFGERAINAHPYGDSFRCTEVLASKPGQNQSGGEGQGEQGAGEENENPTPTETPTDRPEEQKPFAAWLDCSDTIQLVGSNDDFGATCNVCVSGWQSRQSDRVVITFQSQLDSWGNLPNGLQVFPGSTSDDSTNMHSTGANDYYDQKCYAEHFKSINTPPGVYTVPILVGQDNVGQQLLNLNIEVPESNFFAACTAQQTQLTRLSLVSYQDYVNGTQWAADGTWDALFQVDLTSTNPTSTVTYIQLETADANGWPDGTNRIWKTDPGGWFLGAFLGNSQTLNSEQGGVNVNVFPNQSIFLSANDFGAFVAGQTFLLTVYLQDVTLCYVQATITLQP